MEPQVTPSPVTLIKFLDLGAWIAHSLAPWALLVAALYFLLQVIAAVSPGQSAAETVISLLSSVSRTRGFAFVFGFCGALYGLQQRNLRRTETERLHQRIAAFEARLAAASTSPVCPPQQG